MTTTKSDFFAHKVTVFVNPSVTRDAISDVRRQLSELSFQVDVISCEQPNSMLIYHRGDVISGARLGRFCEYARSLRRF